MSKAKMKRSRKEGEDNPSQDGVQDSTHTTTNPLLASKGAVDSRLAALFAGSTGRITTSSKERSDGKSKPNHTSHDKTIDKSPIRHSVGQESVALSSEDEIDKVVGRTSPSRETTDASAKSSFRKRKRKEDDDNLENNYMRRMAELESKELEKKRPSKKVKQVTQHDVDHKEEDDSVNSDDGFGPGESENEGESSFGSDVPDDVVPQHESLNESAKDAEIEKSTRTVFLANVSISAIALKSAKKTLRTHLTSFLPLLSANGSEKEDHKLESIRFRSTAFSSTALPKRAAYARKELMDSTTKSTNAYVVYSTARAAREAVKHLNGTVVLDRHLRVDSVAHPARVDPRRCVFVGNLGFVDDESRMQADAEGEGSKPKKTTKQPADVEEGLWRHFGEVGTVESVRVVRDSKTRVGKGFAYVQFVDINSVEAALLYHDKKFPPLLPRKLRVARARRVKKNTSTSERPRFGGKNHADREKEIYQPKASSNSQSLRGRAGKLLGRAGAAKFKGGSNSMASGKNRAVDGESEMVIEGQRATNQSRPHGLKLGRSGGQRKGKPQTRGSRRAATWRATKGKKD
ncbi:MAG: Nucleolar protein 12 [Peltula sp. TS41687]|nr:MAG: Nucleolar protein 12 [Peltula sp. TS41687]